MSDFFGGSSSTDSTSHSSQATTPWPAASGGLMDVMSKAKQYLDNPPQYYPGQTYLNLNPDQIAALTNLKNASFGLDQSVVNPSMSTWGSMMAGPDESYWNKSLDSYAERANRTLNNSVIPGINDTFTSNGMRTSSRAGVAEGIARDYAAQDILGYNNDLATNFQSLKANNEQYALGQSGNMLNLLMAPGNSQYQAATALTADQQNALNEAMSRYNYNQQSPINMLSLTSPIFQNYGTAFGTTNADSSTHTETSTQQPLFNTLAGAALAAYGIANPATLGGMAAGGASAAGPIAGLGFGSNGIGYFNQAAQMNLLNNPLNFKINSYY